MALYIVTYTPKNETEPTLFLNKLQESDDWARLSAYTYIVKTTESSVELRDRLKTANDSNCASFFVGNLNTSAAWSNMPSEVSDWVKRVYPIERGVK